MYLPTLQPTLAHYRGYSLTYPMLISVFVNFRPECHQEPRDEVESVRPVKRLAGTKPGNFGFRF